MSEEKVHLRRGSYDWTFCGLNCEWGTCRKIASRLEEVTCRKCRKAWGSLKRIKEAVTRGRSFPVEWGKVTCPGCGQEINFSYFTGISPPPPEPDHQPEKG